MPVTGSPSHALPRAYLVWLAGVTVGRLGDAVLAFGLGWAASGHGGTTAAMVLMLGAVPRLVLLLVGGAVADRFGARGILIAGEAALVALAVVLAVGLARYGTPPWLLLVASVALGAVGAFCLPATGSMPRRLVPDVQLPRALALRQGSNQIVLMGAAPVGGALVAGAGLPAAAWGGAVAVGVSLAVLVAVRGLSFRAGEPGPARRTRLRLGPGEGLRIVSRTPGLRRALVLTGAAAALMLPVPSLLVPLLGRASGWGPGPTGAVAGAVGVGVIGAALLAACRRTATPQDDAGPGVSGLVASAAGAAVLAAGQVLDGDVAVAAAVAGALVFGVGNGVFVARLAPFVLGSAPRTHLARVQALVGLAQLVPVLVSTPALGVLAARTSPGWGLLTTAGGLAACVAWAGRRA